MSRRASAHDYRFRWERAVRGSSLAPRTRLVAFALATYADNDGTNARPGVVELAGAAGLPESTVRKHLGSLCALGYLVQITRGSAFGQQASHYHLRIPTERSLADAQERSPASARERSRVSGQPEAERQPASGSAPASEQPSASQRASTGTGQAQDQQAAARATPPGVANLDDAVGLILAELPGWTATAEVTRQCLQALRQDGGPGGTPTIKSSPRGWVKRLLDDADHDVLRAHLIRVRPPALPPRRVREPAGSTVTATPEGKAAAMDIWLSRPRREPVRDAS